MLYRCSVQSTKHCGSFIKARALSKDKRVEDPFTDTVCSEMKIVNCFNCCEPGLTVAGSCDAEIIRYLNHHHHHHHQFIFRNIRREQWVVKSNPSNKRFWRPACIAGIVQSEQFQNKSTLYYKEPTNNFYRAMLRRALLCYSKSSVRLSLFVYGHVFRHVFHTGWNTSKIISLRFLLGLTPTWAIWSSWNSEHPNIRVE